MKNICLLVIVGFYVSACASIPPLCNHKLPKDLQSDVRFSITDPIPSRVAPTPNASPDILFPYNKCLADKGNMDALYRAGFAYEMGYGVEPDFDKAIKYYEQAARGFAFADISRISAAINSGFDQVVTTNSGNGRGGHVEAQYRLALVHQKRNSKSFDLSSAKRWFCEAAKNGHVEARKQCSEIK